MPLAPPPDPPSRADLPDAHAPLFRRVREALATLPFYFRTETSIAGIDATDIFNLNAALGAAIENQVVATLNAMRAVWDPDEAYALYGFVRQSQTFPDVRLQRMDRRDGRDGVLLGIELKGWYLLSKEGVPSFRYTATPAASNPQDLLVVVPWALSNVIGGSPRAFTPYVEGARYAAEYRNHHWQHLRKTKADTGIRHPEDVQPYPVKSDLIADVALSDGGGNFGRFARTGLMDAFVERSLREPLSGIEARHWLSFFQAFRDQSDEAVVDAALAGLAAAVGGASADTVQRAELLVETLRSIVAR